MATEKRKILGSIVKSQLMVAKFPLEPINHKTVFPDMEVLAKKTTEELKKLRVFKIGGHWENVTPKNFYGKVT